MDSAERLAIQTRAESRILPMPSEWRRAYIEMRDDSRELLAHIETLEARTSADMMIDRLNAKVATLEAERKDVTQWADAELRAENRRLRDEAILAKERARAKLREWEERAMEYARIIDAREEGV